MHRASPPTSSPGETGPNPNPDFDSNPSPNPSLVTLTLTWTLTLTATLTTVVTSAWRPGDVTYAALAPPQLLSISSAGLCSVWSAPRPEPDAAEPLCRARFRLAGYGGPAGASQPAAATGSWPVHSAQLPVAEAA
eukprot:scaffold86982_cov48-Phaeocystis_antarctica.AAC.3